MMAVASAAWVPLLVALWIRNRVALRGEAFPALAKFSPFTVHFRLTDRMLDLISPCALAALATLGLLWWLERPARPATLFCWVCGMVLLSAATTAFDPAGMVSWLYS